MTTQREFEESIKARKEAETKNPLLKLGLGELINEMYKLVVLDPNILRDKVPFESMRIYEKYQKLIVELNRRERDYSSYKSPTKY